MRVGGLALSVGAVVWVLRAGGLVASMMVSLPVWRQLDPMPILDKPVAGRGNRALRGYHSDESDQSDDSDQPNADGPDADNSHAAASSQRGGGRNHSQTHSKKSTQPAEALLELH
jgi:hypothetical protein